MMYCGRCSPQNQRRTSLRFLASAPARKSRRLLLQTLGARGVLTLDVDAAHLTMAVVNRYLELKARALV